MRYRFHALIAAALVTVGLFPAFQGATGAPAIVVDRVLSRPRLFFAPGEFRTFLEETKNVRAEYFDTLVGWIDDRGSRAWNERDLQVQSQTLVARVFFERGDHARGTRYLNLARQSLRHYLDRQTSAEFRSSHDLVTGGSRWLEAVALAFDWGYPHWTAAERREMADWLRREIDAWIAGDHVARASPSPFRNDMARAVSGLVAAALTIFDEPGYRPVADRALAHALPLYDEILESHASAGADGGLAEGTFYGSFTAWSQAAVAEMLYTGAGLTDSFRRSPFFEARLRYAIHAAWPGYITNQFGFSTHQLAPVFGDARRGPTGSTLRHRSTALLLGKRLAGSEAARHAYAVIDREEINKTYTREWRLYDLLLWSPKVSRQMPTALAYRERTLGQVFARSAWNDAATWLSFNAGPHLDTHQHYDAGNLTIHRNGVDLLVDSGSLDAFGSRHWYNYYVRTVAHNTVLIHDPAERWRNIWSGVPNDATVNDGGQRTQAPLTPAPTLRQYLNNRDAYDHGSIDRYAAGDWGVYLKSTLTNAYQNPRYQSVRPDGSRNRVKALHVGREVVYLRARAGRRDGVIVFDRIVAAEPEFRKAVLWHAREPFDTPARGRRVDEGERVYESTEPLSFQTTPRFKQGEREGHARLFVTILPVDAVRVRQIGDRPSTGERVDHEVFNTKHFHRHVKDFFVEDPRVLNPDTNTGAQGRPEWPPFAPPELQWLWTDDLAGGWGKTRLQVEPTRPDVADRFLTLLVPTDADDGVQPRASVVRSPDNQAVGVSWQEGGGHLVVLFGMENSGGDLRQADAEIPGGSGELLLVGLTPNTGYRVSASGGSRRRLAVAPGGDLPSGPQGVLRLDLATLAALPGAVDVPDEGAGSQAERGVASIPKRTPAGDVLLAARTPSEVARWAGWLDARVAEGSLKRVSRLSDPLVAGRTIERLAQHVDGIPVFGRQVIVQRDAHTITSLFGDMARVERRQRGQPIPPAVARRAIEATAGVQLPRDREPSLVIVAGEDAGGVLAYCDRVMTLAGPQTICLDAATAEPLRIFDETRRQARAGRGGAPIYYLEDEDSLVEVMNGVAALSPRELAGDEEGGAAEIVSEHLAAITAAWAGRYGVADLLSNPREIVTIVRPAGTRGVAAPSYLGRGVVLFREGDVVRGPGGRAVVAHELAHALIDRSSGLLPLAESRLLEEDFATLLSEWAAGRREPGGGPIRDPFWRSIAIDPGARERFERAVVRAFTRLLPPSATTSLAREAVIASFVDLGGEAAAVVRAWPGP
jgi:hypothetical protein